MKEHQKTDVADGVALSDLLGVGHLVRHGYALGSYNCKCADCGVVFAGDKRASRCQRCAQIAFNDTEMP